MAGWGPGHVAPSGWLCLELVGKSGRLDVFTFECPAVGCDWVGYATWAGSPPVCLPCTQAGIEVAMYRAIDAEPVEPYEGETPEAEARLVGWAE